MSTTQAAANRLSLFQYLDAPPATPGSPWPDLPNLPAGKLPHMRAVESGPWQALPPGKGRVRPQAQGAETEMRRPWDPAGNSAYGSVFKPRLLLCSLQRLISKPACSWAFSWPGIFLPSSRMVSASWCPGSPDSGHPEGCENPVW